MAGVSIPSRQGYLAMILCFLPIGTGAAASFWSLAAGDWHASVKTLSLVDSAIFGVVAPFGCLVAGWICDRVDHKASYCLFGLAQLLLAVVLTRSRRPMQTPVESRIASA